MQDIWTALKTHRTAQGDRTIMSLLQDEGRVNRCTCLQDGLYFDFSKTHIDETALGLLIALAEDAGVSTRRDAMFAGQKINETEGRAVLHTALRDPKGPVCMDGQDVIPAVLDTLARMRDFADRIRSGDIAGQGGAYTDVVNIGIGGSDLGPLMATLALAPYHDGPKIHYVSNVDSAHIADVLKGLDPERTLIIVASKTFTTIETMTNAQTARAWMARKVSNPGAQFAALSSATDKTADFGIPAGQVFGFEDWVGGRYSVWGPIGLGLMLAIGSDAFDEFLAGAHAMDTHFKTAEFGENLPVLLALVGVWHHQICGYPTRAVLPYEQRLARLPAYLQQLEMESNGKSVGMDGTPLDLPSGPIIWGEPGTNGQHAFYQLIHQGTQIVPCEFMVGAQSHEDDYTHHHRLLVANCLAQAEALMKGRSFDAAKSRLDASTMPQAEFNRQAAHRVFRGDRPSTMLIYPKLTPYALGQIIALYEHRVFVEGVILGINSFDQWGVELGKELAIALEPILAGQSEDAGKDISTRNLIKHIKSTNRT